MLCVFLNAMEGQLLSSQQIAFIFPVGLVIVFAVLVFAFGFKSSVEPPSFKYISSGSDDRKNVKKKKVKDKKPQSNGHATVLIDVVDSKKAEPTKAKQSNKVETPKQKKHIDVDKAQEKKADVLKSPSKKEKKANKKNVEIEKPLDFDEGEWEVAPSRKEKKSRKKDEPDVLGVLPDKLSKKKTGTKRDDKLTILEAGPIEILKIEDILPKSVQLADLLSTSIAAPVEPKAASEPAADDAAAKKKKAKKAKVTVAEEAAAPVPAPAAAAAAPVPAPAAVALPVPAPAAVALPVPASADVAESEAGKESLLAFNELEDAWKEAPQKKSKKKVRKD